MGEIKDYKCPCCAAPLVFDAETQNLHCNSCGNNFSLENLQLIDEADANTRENSRFDWDSYSPREFDGEETASLSGYTCPACGAEITGDDSLGSTVCPYCGSSTIIKAQFEGMSKPDYLIPFKIDKQKAVAAFEGNSAKMPFLPKEFKSKKRISEMSGVYVPFWMFDCDCDAAITYNAEKITSWSDSDYDYTKTDYYRLLRSGKVGFANIPVDASTKTDDDYIEPLEPFNYNDAVNFDMAYLSGYLSDKYDVSVEDSKPHANERVKNSTEDAFKKTVDRTYTAVQPLDSSISFSNGKIRYALLPVWMLNIKYKNENYKFTVNGQTGKVVGKYPVDKSKRNLYFLKVLGISGAISAVMAYAACYILR